MLVLNGGSSSIKFAVFNESLGKAAGGSVEKIGQDDCRLAVDGKTVANVQAKDLPAAADFLFNWLGEKQLLKNITAVVHRVVHGMHYTQPQLITGEVMAELRRISTYDPDHLPGEIVLIEAAARKIPGVKQVACFDTSFHSGIPKVARLLPFSRKYYEDGVKKYGFHGISYQYIMEQLGKVAPKQAAGRVIVAHLGSGASMAAIKNGASVDTTMGFTPAGGLVMSTRAGDIDPGVAWYLMQKEKLSPEDFSTLINKQAGLLAVSGSSADMQHLVEKRQMDTHAAEAVDLFCYQAKKFIGAYTAVLSGLDALVFTAGIGEHAPEVRSGICSGLEYLGLNIDEGANEENSQVISTADSRVKVYVIPTNEEYMMAKLAKGLLKDGAK